MDDEQLNEAITRVLLLNTIEALEKMILDTKARTTDNYGNPLDARQKRERENEVKLLRKRVIGYEHDLALLKT